MKAYTDLEQSKKLVKILPLESADMYYQYVLPKSSKIKHNPEIGNPVNALKWYNKGYTTSGKEPITLDEYCVPCWSLAALLDILSDRASSIDEDANVILSSYKTVEWWDLSICNSVLEEVTKSHPVDACVEMILKLKEKDLL